jgi:hypothetical protein
VGELAVDVKALGQPEISHVGLAASVDQDVGGVQVTVQNAALVRMVHRPGRSGNDSGRCSLVGAKIDKPLVEAAARDQLHAEKLQSPALAEFIDGHDVQVVELRHGPGLVLEPHQLWLGGETARIDHLEGDFAIERCLARFVHNPHTSPPKLLQDLVACDGGSRRLNDAKPVTHRAFYGPWGCCSVIQLSILGIVRGRGTRSRLRARRNRKLRR